MITLEVEEMCHECPNFNAVSETSILYGGGRRGKRGKMRVAVYVRAHPAVFEERRRGKKESLRRLRERRRRNRPER